MSAADHASLISFLPAPVLVVDPEGHIIYANPSFHERFIGEERVLHGENLATVFEGGGREAILTAVARVCDSGEKVDFRLMEAGRGYVAVASPIESESSRVGVMVLLSDEQKSDQRLLAFRNQIQEPLDEVRSVLDDLLEQTGGRRAERHRNLLERGVSALERVHKWSDELHGVLVGRRSDAAESSLDPGRVVREVVSVVGSDFNSAGVELELLMPAQLPAVQGDPVMLQSALVGLLRHRLADAARGGAVTLTARTAGVSEVRAVLIAVVDAMSPSAPGDDEQLTADEARDSDEEGRPVTPRVVCDAVAALGGEIHGAVEASGRVTALALLPASE
jgi:nitrogen-specific signal transduction histidine kinase